MLEAGALVLADGGVCWCVELFYFILFTHCLKSFLIIIIFILMYSIDEFSQVILIVKIMLNC